VKRLLAVAALAALGAGATGCDISPPAATVDGVAISQSQLQDQLAQAAGDAVTQCALAIQDEAGGGSLPAVDGSAAGTVTSTFAAYVLDRMVQQTLERRALAQRHATVTAADVAAAANDYRAQLETASTQVSSPCGLTGSDLTGRLPAAFVAQQASLIASQEKLEEVAGHVDVSPGALQSYYASHQSEVTELCLDIIVATDQTSAEAIHNEMAAGTSLADALKGAGVSPETPTGGQGPCLTPATLQSELGTTDAQPIEALADGQVAPPEEITITDPTTGAPTATWFVFGVGSHRLLSFDAAEAGLRQELLAQGGAGLSRALETVARTADVDLDPRYGTWSLKHGVSVPVAPHPALLLNAAAAGSSS